MKPDKYKKILNELKKDLKEEIEEGISQVKHYELRGNQKIAFVTSGMVRAFQDVLESIKIKELENGKSNKQI